MTMFPTKKIYACDKEAIIPMLCFMCIGKDKCTNYSEVPIRENHTKLLPIPILETDEEEII